MDRARSRQRVRRRVELQPRGLPERALLIGPPDVARQDGLVGPVVVLGLLRAHGHGRTPVRVERQGRPVRAHRRWGRGRPPGRSPPSARTGCERSACRRPSRCSRSPWTRSWAGPLPARRRGRARHPPRGRRRAGAPAGTSTPPGQEHGAEEEDEDLPSPPAAHGAPFTDERPSPSRRARGISCTGARVSPRGSGPSLLSGAARSPRPPRRRRRPGPRARRRAARE